MGWALPWVLEYAKRGMEVASREAAKKVAEKAAETLGPPDPPPAPEDPPANEYKSSDRATDAELAKARAKLEKEGFTDIHLPPSGVYFYQLDKDRWGSEPYPKVGQKRSSARTIGGEGCAPSALAIADATLRTTSRTTPREVAAYAVQEGYSGKPGSYGSNVKGLVKAWAEEHGLHREVLEDADGVRAGIDAKGVAVVSVRGGVFNPSGHVIVINGYARDKDGKEWFFVADPGHKNPKPPLVVEKDLHRGAGRVRVRKEDLEKDMRVAYVLSNTK